MKIQSLAVLLSAAALTFAGCDEGYDGTMDSEPTLEQPMNGDAETGVDVEVGDEGVDVDVNGQE